VVIEELSEEQRMEVRPLGLQWTCTDYLPCTDINTNSPLIIPLLSS